MPIFAWREYSSVGHISTGLVNCCSLLLPPNISAHDCDFGLAESGEIFARAPAVFLTID
jgi:hypothetical protein